MVFSAVILLTLFFYTLFCKRAKKSPTLQQVILVTLSFLAVIQNVKFFYLMFAPNLKAMPYVGAFLSQGMGVVEIPNDFESCLDNLGSEFDRFNLALGPVAVIWLSLKQILDFIPQKSTSKRQIVNQKTKVQS